jgi:transcriptional regulator with XRE-family HTH domain
MDFGTHIRNIREEKQLLLRQLAAAVDMDVAYLSKIERGNREARKEQVIAFAKALEQDENELLMLWMADKIFNTISDEQDGLKILNYAKEKHKT